MTDRNDHDGPEHKFDLGSGVLFEWESKYPLDFPDLPVILEVEVDVEDERLVVTELTIRRRPGGGPITADVLRAIPLARLTLSAVTGSSSNRLRREGLKGWTMVTSADALGNLDDLPELERIALVYRWGYFIGQNPTQWVAEKLGLGYAVAAKRVQAARLAGLLEPTTKGRKGA